ncbi:hypothetical protein [Halorussus halobius]|uniref:hypothetical protein n=1 Tax=Halorussus halobius TaxID=1710537 RepID=UPI001092C5C0|nr:hypothetical protein [Halorussus halobius]
MGIAVSPCGDGVQESTGFDSDHTCVWTYLSDRICESDRNRSDRICDGDRNRSDRICDRDRNRTSDNNSNADRNTTCNSDSNDDRDYA